MTKNDLYNQLLEKVHKEGGFVRFNPMKRPCIYINGKTTRHINAAAVFEGADDSSPLKVLSNRFTAYDIDDYLNEEDIEILLTQI